MNSKQTLFSFSSHHQTCSLWSVFTITVTHKWQLRPYWGPPARWENNHPWIIHTLKTHLQEQFGVWYLDTFTCRLQGAGIDCPTYTWPSIVIIHSYLKLWNYAITLSDLQHIDINIVGLSFPFHACCGGMVHTACMFHIISIEKSFNQTSSTKVTENSLIVCRVSSVFGMS